MNRKSVLLVLLCAVLAVFPSMILVCRADAWAEGDLVAVYPLSAMNITVVSNAFGLAFNGTHLVGHSSPTYNNPTTPYYFIDPITMDVFGPFLGPDRYDTPHPGQAGNTHDLAYGDSCIWAAFGGASDDIIWKFEPWTGVILDSFTSPRSPADPYGLAHDGKYLWLSESKQNSVSIIYKINTTTKQVVDQFNYSNPLPDKPYGLAFGAGFLWIIGSTRIYKVVPSTHEVIRSLPNPANNTYYDPGFAHLACDGTYLWAADDHNLYKMHALSPSMVGGFLATINKFELVAPCTALASFLLIAAVSVHFTRRKKRRQED